MSWTKPVFSSHVQSVGWDEESQELIIEWQSGRVSVYEGVDEGTALALANAPSVGKMLHAEIKMKYPHRYAR